MLIIPTRNGFALMPWDMNCLLHMADASKESGGVLVATDVEGLKDCIEQVYGSPPNQEKPDD